MDGSSGLKELDVIDLKVGMYVVVQASWFNHPFFKNRFVIHSQNEINEIIESGIKKVLIDPARSTVKEMPRKIAIPPVQWKPEKIVPRELRDAIENKSLSIDIKAAIVRRCSLEMMKKLTEKPTAENIRDVKKGIYCIVDFILSGDLTTGALLKITDHDYYTYTHSVNVGFLSLLMAKAVFRHSAGHDLRALGAGFFLHDLGKVKVRSEIINKPGQLTEEEWKEMRLHPKYGFNMLQEADELTKECKVIVLQHHEREDGSGYPAKLRGGDIHLYAKICSIADVYDALTTARPYKEKVKPFEALRIMKDEMMSHIHRRLFEAFVLLLKDLE